jgi:flagellar hook-associated protein 2
MTIANTTSNSLASLLSSTLNGVNGSNGSNGSSSASVTGSPISTGPIDVNTLVSELMTVESQPLTQLQSQQSGVQAKLSAFGQVQSALSSLDTAISALKTNSAFTAAQATVTGSGVGATVSGSPASGSYSVVVSAIAQAQAAASAPLASASTVVGTGTLTIQLGTYNSGTNAFTAQAGSGPVNITINSSNDTLGGIASAINGASAGVNASVVTDNLGSRLVLSSSNTGTANQFKMTVADSDGTNTDTSGLSQLAFDPTAAAGAGKNLTQTQAAADAQYSINGLSLTSSTNSITTAVSGLTLNLTQAPAVGSTLQAQVTVGTDSSAVSSNVNTFIQSYNSLVKLEGSLTAYNASTNTPSTLTGDTSMFALSSQLRSILGSQLSGVSGSPSWLADVGIDFQSDGTLSLNTTKFGSALSANPSGVVQLFTKATGTASQQGFAVQLASTVESMLSPTGLLGGTQTSLQSTITSMNNQISQMQTQLSQTQQRLITQYSQLNADMVVAQQNQVALANALAGLPA